MTPGVITAALLQADMIRYGKYRLRLRACTPCNATGTYTRGYYVVHVTRFINIPVHIVCVMYLQV